MTGFLQRLVGGDAQNAGETLPPQLTLAAFGKHPGWDDHIPGIGLVTENLAQVKQSLYVAGIGGQIDSGAWEKLEAGKRVEGFNHTFLWRRSRQLVLGLFWSSMDRKGRAKYPMVLCVESQGMTPRFLLTHVRPELERLREACRSATTAEQVAAVCADGQDRLDALWRRQSAELQALEPVAVRRSFLEHPSLGPDRLGLLRVQHELASAFDALRAQGNSARDLAQVRARHVRVPLAGDSTPAQLVLWAELFQCALPPNVPVLLISREGANWIEAISGEPAKDDFFCLQAAPAAIPITTQIPYELPPESQARLQELEKKFLQSTGESPPPLPGVPPPLPAAAPPPAQPATSGKSKSWWFIVLAVLVAAGVVAALLLQPAGEAGKSPVVTETNPPTAPKPAVPEPNVPEALNAAEEAEAKRRAEEQAKAEIEARQRADEKSKAEAEALRLAREKLAVETAAKQEAEARRLAEAKAKAEADRIAEAKRAAEAEAARRAEEQRIAVEKAAAEKARIESAFATALEAGRTALAATNHAEALAQAGKALNLKPGDPAAVALKKDAEQSKALAEAEAYFTRQEYEAALALCASHSGVPAFDALARKVREAQSQSAAQQSQQLVQRLDVQFEVLRVRFGLIKARDAVSDEAKKENAIRGLSPREIDHYLKVADQLEKAYPAEALDQNDRISNLKKLKDEIKLSRSF